MTLSPGALHVLVLAGGLSHEREVSLRSGSRIASALRAGGHEVTVRDVDASLLRSLADDAPDVAINALHGGRGEDGSIQTVLELAGIPLVGSPSGACRLAWDKATSKVLAERAGVVTPRWVTVSHSMFRDLGAAELVSTVAARLSFPLVVKPNRGGSALGVTWVLDVGELPSALVAAFAYGDVLLIEEQARGIEVAVSLVGSGAPRVLPAVEVVAPNGIYDYEARYTAGLTEFHTPARLSDAEADAVAAMALKVHETLGLRDVSRVDAVVGPDGVPSFLEVNVSPGLTETSLLPMSVAAAGADLGAVFGELAAARI